MNSHLQMLHVENTLMLTVIHSHEHKGRVKPGVQCWMSTGAKWGPFIKQKIIFEKEGNSDMYYHL